MTVALGYDKPLYVLPFDHRATFSKNMFGWTGPLRGRQESTRVVEESSRRAGVHRLRGWPDRFLGSVHELPRQQDRAQRCGRANRRILPPVGGRVREKGSPK